MSVSKKQRSEFKKAWLMDDATVDPQQPHQRTPGVFLTVEDLAAIGVEYFHMHNLPKFEDDPNKDPELQEIRTERGYKNFDVCDISAKGMQNFDAMKQKFYDEHLHRDDEVRYVLDGSGYFDVRNLDDEWVRIHVEKGDLITLPTGIFHRFTPDANDRTKCMRLFKEEPRWLAISRSNPEAATLSARLEYLERYDKQRKQRIAGPYFMREPVTDKGEDQRDPLHMEPPQYVSWDTLTKLGVLYWRLNADENATDPTLQRIRAERSYKNHDLIYCSREKLPDYDNKIKSFFTEHLHEDEEIRYVLEGTGFFDVRDDQERWIRIPVRKGDMIVLPEGIYHRFTLDRNNCIQAMRLFKEVPKWTPLNRVDEATDKTQARKNYLHLIGAK